MYNKAILMGRICNDLELKTIPNGASVLSFRLAVDRSYQISLTLSLGEALRSLFHVTLQRAE